MIDLSMLDQVPLQNTCEYCGTSIGGRSDKRFCGDSCGIRFGREEKQLETNMEQLFDAIAEKETLPKYELCKRHDAQVAIQRNAIAILDILERKATVNPTVDRAILLSFKNEILAQLFDLDETSSGYPTYHDQLDAYVLSELMNPFNTEEW